eukprot:TRINITY_DN24843_c0_g2_i1.p1 TRINITY_DN24843_c0_g2~~TRINITY_DN24843_c0_g2_i1.p1  ORF type:complete len:491 (+),score=115.52 TRINITY_DN24843_c0_g2_i1:228-1700(+)
MMLMNGRSAPPLVHFALQAELRRGVEEYRCERQEAEVGLAALQAQRTTLRRRLGGLEEAVEVSQRECAEMRGRVSELTEESVGLRDHCASRQLTLLHASCEEGALLRRVEELRDRCEWLEAKVASAGSGSMGRGAADGEADDQDAGVADRELRPPFEVSASRGLAKELCCRGELLEGDARVGADAHRARTAHRAAPSSPKWAARAVELRSACERRRRAALVCELARQFQEEDHLEAVSQRLSALKAQRDEFRRQLASAASELGREEFFQFLAKRVTKDRQGCASARSPERRVPFGAIGSAGDDAGSSRARACASRRSASTPPPLPFEKLSSPACRSTLEEVPSMRPPTHPADCCDDLGASAREPPRDAAATLQSWPSRRRTSSGSSSSREAFDSIAAAAAEVKTRWGMMDDDITLHVAEDAARLRAESAALSLQVMQLSEQATSLPQTPVASARIDASPRNPAAAYSAIGPRLPPAALVPAPKRRSASLR